MPSEFKQEEIPWSFIIMTAGTPNLGKSSTTGRVVVVLPCALPAHCEKWIATNNWLRGFREIED
jgi:hypothetical protein